MFRLEEKIDYKRNKRGNAGACPWVRKVALSCAISAWLSGIFLGEAQAAVPEVQTKVVTVSASQAQEEAKYNPQSVQIITKDDIKEKQAKTVEDIIFSESGVTRSVDAMGRVGISIRGAEPRHTLLLVDGQPVLGDFDKYSGSMDEVMRLGTENLERIEVIKGAAGAKYGAGAVGGVVNLVTRKPASRAELQINGEGLHRQTDGGVIDRNLPFKNMFIRADSGDIGKFRVALYGSKRDVLPVLANENRHSSGFAFDYKNRTFAPNVLRYFGDTSDTGILATYEANDRHRFDVRMGHYWENLHRTVKHSDSDLEPQQDFKRKANRNVINVSWQGKSNSSDWRIEGNYTRIREDDAALINYTGHNAYEGANELRYIDTINHKQWDIRAIGNTSIGDNHLLSYGATITREFGRGSRLKNSPHLQTMYIDPWDYDKSLLVDTLDRHVRRKGDNTVRVYSHIHDYKFVDGKQGMPLWDMNYEYYGADYGNSETQPDITYDDYITYDLGKERLSSWRDTAPNGKPIDEAFRARYEKFERKLERENPNNKRANIVGDYFKYGESNDVKIRSNAPIFNGKAFLEEYRNRNQRITMGSGSIERRSVFISDLWQANERTVLVPSLRLDSSSLFGTNISAMLGMTYNLKGNAHRRFKANVGTGYTEPGMGELWYNWEMYSSTPVGIGAAKLGWYWVGNPNLRPEKSLNFDIGIEGENKNTYARVGVFHNRIRDYMSIYFTGNFIDFAPYLDDSVKYQRAPDMMYSFKNIGRADITGIEAEVRQRFGAHWSARLGYTYLHAINKSDPNMPRQLLDKPVHKIDIGLTYTNAKSGWSGQIWGDYYINMLDSNSLASYGNYWPEVLESGIDYQKQVYTAKTFGIWNAMVQKQVGANAKVYLGISNIFNHRDDDRATQERVYRLGVNLAFGSGGYTKEKDKLPRKNMSDDISNNIIREDSNSSKIKEDFSGQTFLATPFKPQLPDGIHLIGSYQARWMSHGGANRPQSPYRLDATVGSAREVMRDAADHGMEQSLHFGLEGKINEHTQVTLLGHAGGTTTLDTASTAMTKKGLGTYALEAADITSRVKKHWDISIGRLQESMGLSGYWFGKSYDGVRVVWTGDKTQVRLGYGDFSRYTGITDSAYTHAVHATFYRPPTVAELIGLNRKDYPYDVQSAAKSGSDGVVKGRNDEPANDSPTGIYERLYRGRTNTVYFYQQLADIQRNNALSDSEKIKRQQEIVASLLDVVKMAYPEQVATKHMVLNIPQEAKVVFAVKNKAGDIKYLQTRVYFNSTIYNSISQEEREFINSVLPVFSVPLSNKEALVDGKNYIKSHWEEIQKAYTRIGERSAKEHWGYVKQDGTIFNVVDLQTMKSVYLGNGLDISGYEYAGIAGFINEVGYDESYNDIYERADLAKSLYDANYTKVERGDAEYGWRMPEVLFNYLYTLEQLLYTSEDGNTSPRETLGNILGNVIQVQGIVLNRDYVPPIDKAAFVQVRHQFTPNLGIGLWYFTSLGKSPYTISHASGGGNELYQFDSLAHILGIGLQYQVGHKAKFTFEYGQNYTAFGRHLNGHTLYEHERGTADFTLRGYESGKAPDFWLMRLDIGQSDYNKPGSWNAFIDYKQFRHGAFFGGNGSGAVPDRYLDGIRSITIGGGYVPLKDFLIEAFYTMDAKGLGTRDTLYGSEKFTLGNYLRVQGTYRF